MRHLETNKQTNKQKEFNKVCIAKHSLAYGVKCTAEMSCVTNIREDKHRSTTMDPVICRLRHAQIWTALINRMITYFTT